MRKSGINKFNILYILTIASLLYLTGFMFLPKTAKCLDTWANYANDITFLQNADGSSADPYQISTAPQLASLANLVLNGTTFEGKFCTLMDSIDLSAYEWIPIGTSFGNISINNKPFKGTFDGNACTISGIKINSSSSTQYAGLFGYTLNATIKNLIVSGENNLSNVTAYSYLANTYAGGVVAYAQNTTFSNITNLGVNVYSFSEYQNSYAGGIVGLSSSCSFNQVSNYANVLSYVTIKNNNSSNFTEVCSYSGGIIGKSEGTNGNITYARNNGKIISLTNGYYLKTNYFLGIPIGQLQMQIGISYAGGITGKTNYTISLSFNSGEVLSGSNDNFSSNGSFYNVSLPKQSYAGGITGQSLNTITNVFNTGKISSNAQTTTRTKNYTYTNSKIRVNWELMFGYEWYSANPYVWDYPALWFGENDKLSSEEESANDIETPYVFNIKEKMAYSGGIVGYSEMLISNAYNNGTITGGKSECSITFTNETAIRTSTKKVNYYYHYSTISYSQNLFYSAINGNRESSNLNLCYGNQSYFDYYSTVVTNSYNDKGKNKISGTLASQTKNGTISSSALAGTSKYIDKQEYQLSINPDSNNLILTGSFLYTIHYYIYTDSSGQLVNYDYSFTPPSGNDFTLLIQPKYYTTLLATLIDESTLNNTVETLWEKNALINNGMPFIRNFYW